MTERGHDDLNRAVTAAIVEAQQRDTVENWEAVLLAEARLAYTLPFGVECDLALRGIVHAVAELRRVSGAPAQSAEVNTAEPIRKISATPGDAK